MPVITARLHNAAVELVRQYRLGFDTDDALSEFRRQAHTEGLPLNLMESVSLARRYLTYPVIENE